MTSTTVGGEFGRFVDALNAAGVVTKSARGFWGGVSSEGDIVVTSWVDACDANGRYFIWRPATNHGGLKASWDAGEVHVGAAVQLILLRQRGHARLGGPPRWVGGALLHPGRWRVSEMVEGQSWHATIELDD